MKIGSHVNNSGDLMLYGSAIEAVSYGANTFMVYLGAPQNSYRKDVEEFNIEKMWSYCQQNNIDKKDVLVHAPYIVNLAQYDEEKRQTGVNIIINEMKLAEELGFNMMVIHPGSHVGYGINTGLQQIVKSIKTILNETTTIQILIETMAGKGTECCSRFEEISYILREINNTSRLKVCFDSCHVFDAGYDIVNDYENVLRQFDMTIGLDQIKAIHLNDSQNHCGSHKDRHANIGYGMIGFPALLKLAQDTRFSDIIKITETPLHKNNETGTIISPYKNEILMLKTGIFNPHLFDE